MKRDESKELERLGVNAEVVMKRFCNTAAYKKVSDSKLHKTLKNLMTSRGGVSLKPGDGVIHYWFHRFLLTYNVLTDGDSHTCFPIGVYLRQR